MIQTESKRSKKRKCKKGRTSQNLSTKEMTDHLILPTNHLEKVAGEPKCIQQSEMERCLICRVELPKISGHVSEMPSSLVDHISANICKACQESVNKNDSPLLANYINGKDSPHHENLYSNNPDGNCHCLNCPEKNSRHIGGGSTASALKLQEHRSAWQELKQVVQMVYWGEGLRLGDSLLPYCLSPSFLPPAELPSISHLRHIVHRLCEADPQRLFQCLHNQVQVFVAEMRLRLLHHLVASNPSTHGTAFARRLIEEYTMLCSAAAKAAPFLSHLDENHLRHFNLNWELVNRHLFYNLIFSDPFIFAGLPEVVTHQRLGCVSPDCSNDCHQALKKFDEEMKNVSSFWQETHNINEQLKSSSTCHHIWETSLPAQNKCGCVSCAETRLRRPSELRLLASKVEEESPPSRCCISHSQECQHLASTSPHLSTNYIESSNSPLCCDYQSSPESRKCHRPSPETAPPPLVNGYTAVAHIYSQLSAETSLHESFDSSPLNTHHHQHQHTSTSSNEFPLACLNLEAEAQDILQEQLCLMTYGDWDTSTGADPGGRRNQLPYLPPGWGDLPPPNTKSSTASSSKTSSSSRLANDLELSSAGDEFENHLPEGESLDDSSSEQSSSAASSSSNHRESRVCDCCYCEVFGRNSTSLEPRSKGYLEMREKLRLELQRRKEEGLLPIRNSAPQTTAAKQQLSADINALYDTRAIDELVKYINGSTTHQTTSPSATSAKKSKKKRKQQNSTAPSQASPASSICDSNKNMPSTSTHMKKSSDFPSSDSKHKSLEKPMTNGKTHVKGTSSLHSNKPSQENKCQTTSISSANDTLINNNNSSSKKKGSNNISNNAFNSNNTCSNNTNNKNNKKCNNNNNSKQQSTEKLSPSKKQAPPPTQQVKSSSGSSKKNNVANNKVLNNSGSNNDSLIPQYLMGPDSPISITIVNNKDDKNSLSGGKPMVTIKAKQDPPAASQSKKATNDSLSSKGPTYTSTSDGKNSIITVSLSNSKLQQQGTNKTVAKPPITVFVDNGKDEYGVSLKNLKLPSSTGKPKKNKKKKNMPENISPDDVFMPMENIDLENGDLDESDRVIEAFKRFCLDSKPPAHKEKVQINLTKDLVLPKKKNTALSTVGAPQQQRC